LPPFTEARKVLVCLRYGIGDVVMELPALHALRQVCGAAHVTALGASPALQLLEGDWRVDRLASVHRWGLTHWGDTGSEAIHRDIARWLEEEGFELFLDPSHAVNAVRDVIWSVGGAILDTGGGMHEPMLEKGFGGDRAIKSAVRGGWGLPVPRSLLPELSLLPQERSFARSSLSGRLLERSPLIACSPVASSPLKRWPLAKLARVMDDLLEESGGRALLLCGPQKMSAESFLGSMRHRNRVKVVGSLHLRLIGAMLARTSLFVCNDTGLMHLAAAVSTTSLALFGPTSPRVYRPPASRTVTIDRDADGCPLRRVETFGPSECLVRGECSVKGAGCIAEIDEEEVLSTGLAMLAGFREQIREGGYARESA
jgi:ADP-heptose:LPS heptosyltransferase